MCVCVHAQLYPSRKPIYIYCSLTCESQMLKNPKIIGMDLEGKNRKLARSGEQLQSRSV